jgi:hypothetical protein
MKKDAIKLEIFCEFHHVEHQLIYSFIDYGFFDVIKENEDVFIPNTAIEDVERCIRLSNELGVNLAGLEVINNMRQKMLQLREELNALKHLKNELIRAGRFDNEDDIIEFYLSKGDN